MSEQDRSETVGERRHLAGPRLELPRFQFAPRAEVAPAAPQLRPSAFATQFPRVAAPPHTTYAPTSAPTYAAAPALAAPTYAVAPAPAMATPAPAPAPVPAPAPFANTTRPATISWDRLEQPAGEQTLLQRITPVHMGLLLVLVVFAMVLTSGPAAMNAKPTRLPATAAGGGRFQGEVMPARSGATATNAATATATAAPAATPRARAALPERATAARARVRMLRVGSATVRARVRSGGIPSPAAAANLAIAGGGRVAAGSTDAVQLNGIPSAAASEQLGPAKLPFRATDGVTLPRMVGERDSHAVDSHYGADTLPMEEPVALPAMTPGQSAARAEAQVIRNDLAPTDGIPAPGEVRAF